MSEIFWPGLYFYREQSNVTWEEFLTTKFRLWIDTRSSTNNTLHCSGRAVEKCGILHQIKKAPETRCGHITCYVFSLEDTVAHLCVTDPSSILTIEKQNILGLDQNGKFWGLSQIEKSLVGLDKCEIRAIYDFDATYTTTTGWSGSKDQQNKTDVFLSVM